MDSIENPFLVTLRLPVSHSPIIVTVLTMAHIFCLLIPWLTGLDLIYKVLLTCCPVFGLAYLIYKYCSGFTKERTTELILAADDDWQIKRDNGEIYPAIMGDSLFVHPALTIILLKYVGNKEYFIFTLDNLEPDLFRRLRVRLRFRVNQV
jgi:hypothetical protein